MLHEANYIILVLKKLMNQNLNQAFYNDLLRHHTTKCFVFVHFIQLSSF